CSGLVSERESDRVSVGDLAREPSADAGGSGPQQPPRADQRGQQRDAQLGPRRAPCGFLVERPRWRGTLRAGYGERPHTPGAARRGVWPARLVAHAVPGRSGVTEISGGPGGRPPARSAPRYSTFGEE